MKIMLLIERKKAELTKMEDLTHTEEPKERIEKVDTKALRDQLNKLNELKEAEFKKKTEYTKRIDQLIADINDIKQNRNTKVEDVKGTVDERSKLNSIIKDKIEEIKKIEASKKDLMAKSNISEDPSKIKSMIDRLEARIETEGMTFDKEEKVMKLIKDLKRKYESNKALMDLINKSQTLSREISSLKKQADGVHRDIQSKAKVSQQDHEKLVKFSKEVKDLKVLRKTASDNFKKYKEDFKKLSEQFKGEFDKKQEVRKEFVKKKKEAEEKVKQTIKKELAQMKQEVQEKIKTGKKLTTEDLLLFQGDDSED